MENPQIQLFQLLGLALFTNPDNVRAKTSKTYFKVLNAIYLFTKTNLENGLTEHFPCKETLAKKAKCSRSQITRFITSTVCKEFCDIHREYDPETKRYKANRYYLKDWVFDLFRLFWRSGMMKHFQTKYDWWIFTFKKRIYSWLIPLLDAGKTVNQIFAGFVNKLSTENPPKRAAANPLKRADNIPMGNTYTYGTRINRRDEVLNLPSLQAFTFLGNQMITRFGLREGDVNSIMNSFRLIDLKRGYKIHNQRVNSGFVPKSPVAAFISAIEQGRKVLRL
jgi:hypothetical protein